MKNKLKKLHSELYYLIRDNYNYKEKKRHGSYLGVDIFDKSVIWMDDYNSAIRRSNKFMCKGFYFGLDFGGFSSEATERDYLWAIADIKSTITKNPCKND